MTILLREAIGDRLRHTRTTQHRTLREISRAARVSLGYLSEVERGRKEASSELLASICEALDLPLAELLHDVATDIGAMERVDSIEDVPVDADAVPAGDGKATRAPISGGRLVDGAVGTHLADLRLSPSLAHRLPTAITPSGITQHGRGARGARAKITVAA